MDFRFFCTLLTLFVIRRSLCIEIYNEDDPKLMEAFADIVVKSRKNIFNTIVFDTLEEFSSRVPVMEYFAQKNDLLSTFQVIHSQRLEYKKDCEMIDSQSLIVFLVNSATEISDTSCSFIEKLQGIKVIVHFSNDLECNIPESIGINQCSSSLNADFYVISMSSKQIKKHSFSKASNEVLRVLHFNEDGLSAKKNRIRAFLEPLKNLIGSQINVTHKVVNAKVNETFKYLNENVGDIVYKRQILGKDVLDNCDIDYLYPLEFAHFTVVLPCVEDSGWLIILRPFQRRTRTLYGCLFLFYCIVYYMLRRLSNARISFKSAAERVFNAMVGYQLFIKRYKKGEKVIIGAIFISSLLLATAYQSILIEQLLQQHTQNTINSIDELKSMKIILRYDVSFDDAGIALIKDKLIETQIVFEKSFIKPWKLKKTDDDPNIGYIIDRKLAQSFLDSSKNYKNSQSRYYLIDENLLVLPTTFYIRKALNSKSMLDNQLMRYEETGSKTYLHLQLNTTLKMNHKKANNVLSRKTDFTAILRQFS